MSLSTPLVLVADDEPSMLELVARHLRTMKNPTIEVIEASDGEQAWSLAQEHLPDLVVLDVMMPGMSGWEVCRKIREDVSLAHTGVLMLTGIGENLNQLTSPLYGADAYIDKPFDFGELDEKVRTALEAREGQREGISRPRLNGVGGAARPAKRVLGKAGKKAAAAAAKKAKAKGKPAKAKAKSTAPSRAKNGKAAKASTVAKATKGAKAAKAVKKGAKAAKSPVSKAASKAPARKVPAPRKAAPPKKGAPAVAAKRGASAKNGASARTTNGRNHAPARAAAKAPPKAKPVAARKPAPRGKARATR